jgi:hypothetical protein
MRNYYNPGVLWDDLTALKTGLTENAASFDARKVRLRVQGEECFELSRVCRYALRPFDTRWCYYSDVSPLWNRSRPTLWRHCWKGNSFLMSRPAGAASPEGFPFFHTALLGDNDFLRGHAYYFPIRLRAGLADKPAREHGNGQFDNILHEAGPAYKAGGEKITANLSPAARAYLADIGVKNPDSDAETAALIWMHALAIGYSPAYLAGNADGIRQDWPRIPLPDSKAALLASAGLGRQVAALLDTETPLTGVTDGNIRPELKTIAVLSSTEDLSLTAGWGHAGQNGVTMPGKGKLQIRACTTEELAVAAAGRPAQTSSDPVCGGLPSAAAPFFGPTTCDIYLNDSACWSNVPEKVWDCTIGGYQVIKKWLSYRERALLGRALTAGEAREVTHTARRIAALVLLQPELDANYERVKSNSCEWTK